MLLSAILFEPVDPVEGCIDPLGTYNLSEDLATMLGSRSRSEGWDVSGGAAFKKCWQVLARSRER